MMRRLAIFTIFILSITQIFAQKDSLNTIFETANNYYIDENFEQAIKNYEIILEKKYESAELYYNMGNTYFKQNKIADAILYYEKAHKLAPNDKDIIYNLNHANSFVDDKFTIVSNFILDRIFVSVLHICNSNTWSLISINTFILALAVFFIFLFSKIISRRKFAFLTSVVLILFSVITFTFAAQAKKRITEPNSAVIMKISTIKSSPGKDGTDLYILNPGVKVGIKSKNDNWYEVKLPNGKIGWINIQNVEVI